MMRFSRMLALAFAAILTVTAARAAERVALVIGNGAYAKRPLPNPKNDARAIAAEFRKLGFQVIEKTDLDKAGFDGAVTEFIEALDGAEIAAFFYAGHGNQFPKDNLTFDNYLIPVNSAISVASQAKFRFVSVSDIQDAMAGSAKKSLLFIDACRNDLLDDETIAVRGARSASPMQGFINLAARRSRAETLVSYSTAFSEVAADGDGANSPYATALLKHLGRRDAPIEGVLKEVRREVRALTGGKQDPTYVSDLVSDVVLNASPPPPPVAEAAPAAAPTKAEIAWEAVKESGDCELIRAFRNRYGRENPVLDRLAETQLAMLGGACAPPRIASAQPQPEAPLAAAPQAAPDGGSGSPGGGQTPLAVDPAETSRKLQNALKDAGCYSGVADGQWGPKSREALRKFAAAAKRDIAAEPTEATLAAVAAAAGARCQAVATVKPDAPVAPAKKTTAPAAKAVVVQPKVETPKKTTPKTETKTKTVTATKTARPSANSASYKYWAEGDIPNGAFRSTSTPWGTLTCSVPASSHGARSCSWQ